MSSSRKGGSVPNYTACFFHQVPDLRLAAEGEEEKEASEKVEAANHTREDLQRAVTAALFHFLVPCCQTFAVLQVLKAHVKSLKTPQESKDQK